MSAPTATNPDVPDWGPRGTAAAVFAARLAFEHVSLSFGAIAAVHDVSFELQPGEVICLLGPSGCGKTTLLRIAAGVERPQAGRVLLDGKEVAGPSAFVPPEKRNVGLMFQDFALFPHLSILHNVTFGLKHLDRKLAVREARAALRRVGLTTYENSYPHELSGGEQQRVALARAIVPRPSVVLMDEPFSGLDQRLRQSVRRETQIVLRETRASAMLVTHDPAEAMGMADRILLMRQGKLIQTGTPDDLYNHPVDIEAARFFSDFNELPGVVRKGVIATALGGIKNPGFQDGQNVIVMIRPEGLVLADNGALAGQVVQSRFAGEYTDLQVMCSGADEAFSVRTSQNQRPGAGQRVKFTINDDHVLAFASE